jgi:anti-sigma B factor antagonist
MEIIETKNADTVVLQIEGRLDTNTASSFEEKLMDLISENKNRIIVDFSDLDFISSSGLRVLLMAGKKVKTTNGKLGLCSLKDHIKEVFDVAGFTMLFSMFPNQEEALENIQ